MSIDNFSRIFSYFGHIGMTRAKGRRAEKPDDSVAPTSKRPKPSSGNSLNSDSLSFSYIAQLGLHQGPNKPLRLKKVSSTHS